MTLLRLAERGLYCEAGDFYIDPWQPVERAVITHGHGDHARWGSERYLCSREGADGASHATRPRRDHPRRRLRRADRRQRRSRVAPSCRPHSRLRAGPRRASRRGVGRVRRLQDAARPDVHAVRARALPHVHHREHVRSADLSLDAGPRGVRRDPRVVASQPRRTAGRRCCSATRSARRSGCSPAWRMRTSGPVYTHGAVERLNRDYRRAGVRLADTRYASGMPRGHDFAGSLIVAPPSAAGSLWIRRFGSISTGFASGWMRVRGARRRRAVDRGFVLSDHVDWPSLLATVEGTGAERVWVTHGTREPLVRWLTERGIEARVGREPVEGRRGHRPRRSRRRGDPRVRRFAQLFAAIDETTRTNEKVDAMVDYFRSADPADAAWAVWFLSGGRPKRLIPVRRLAAWAMEEAGGSRSGCSRSAMTPLAISPRRCRCCCRTARARPTSRCIAGSRSACFRSRRKSEDGAAREHRAMLARARRHGAVHLEQADHRRLSRWSVAAARRASARARDGRG